MSFKKEIIFEGTDNEWGNQQLIHRLEFDLWTILCPAQKMIKDRPIHLKSLKKSTNPETDRRFDCSEKAHGIKTIMDVIMECKVIMGDF